MQLIHVLRILMVKKASYFLDNIVSKWPLWAGFTLSEQGLFNLPYAVQSCLGNFTISRFLSLVSDGQITILLWQKDIFITSFFEGDKWFF